MNIDQVLYQLNEKKEKSTKQAQEEDTAAQHVLTSLRTRVAQHFHIDNCDEKYG